MAKADLCQRHERDEHETYLEAAIAFGRSEIQRLEPKHKGHSQWKAWWQSLLNDPSVQFLREHRDHILHEAPPKIGQTVYVGHEPPSVAHYYHYEDQSVPAADTVRRHLARVRQLSEEARKLFGSECQE